MNTLLGPNGRNPAVAKLIFDDIGLEGNGLVVPVVPKGSDKNVAGPSAGISDGLKGTKAAEWKGGVPF